jgi:hypothetical protein
MENSTISLMKRKMKNQMPKKSLNLKRRASTKRRANPGKARDCGGVLVGTMKLRGNLLRLLQPFK